MPKTFSKIVVLGASAVGKTSIIEQIVYANYFADKEMHPTAEDTYDCWIEVDTDKSQKERVRFYDLKGLDCNNVVLPFHHVQIADGFLLVFSVTSKKSFALVDHLKKEVERLRGKDFPVVVLGTKIDLIESRECEHALSVKWANHEKVKMFEVLPVSRNTLQEPVTCLVKKIWGKRLAEMKGLFRRGGTGKSFKERDLSES